jgi:hypothetical protein
MKKILKTTFVILAVLLAKPTQAQFYVGAGAGIYALANNLPNMSYDNPGGYALRAGYVYPLTKKLGIGAGLEYARFSQTATANNNFSYNTFLVDDTNSAFEYRLKTIGYTEEQRLQSLLVPVFLQFKTPINKGTHFYARGGIKYMIPQKFTASATATRVEAAGYYPDVNLLIVDLPSRGFGTTEGYSQSGTYKTQNVIMSSFEVGFSFQIAKKGALYAGIYLDQATRSIIANDSNQSFIGYNPTSVSNRPLNGLFSTKTSAEVKPQNFGFSLSYSFE